MISCLSVYMTPSEDAVALEAPFPSGDQAVLDACYAS